MKRNLDLVGWLVDGMDLEMLYVTHQGFFFAIGKRRKLTFSVPYRTRREKVNSHHLNTQVGDDEGARSRTEMTLDNSQLPGYRPIPIFPIP